MEDTEDTLPQNVSSTESDPIKHAGISKTCRKDPELTVDPDTPIKEMDSKHFCRFLELRGISNDVVSIFKTQKISGAIFLDLTKEDLKDMKLTKGDEKLILQFQAKYTSQPVQNGTKSCSKKAVESQVSQTKLSEEIKKWCRQLPSKGPLKCYELPQQDITRDNTNQIATVQLGPKNTKFEATPGKVLMVVGATGAGKSTLINAMVNYIFGVQWEDDFRFKMIVEAASADQSKSVTKWITAYTIPAQNGSPVPFTLTIIDTPGFGDTEGIERDKHIVKQVKELFGKRGRGGIDQLHGIGFVAQAALARLTHTQRYIFDSILAIFGKDVGKNVFMMVTFADGQKPPVLDAVEASKIAYDTAFKFNNSAIYCETQSKQNQFDRLFWEMGMNSLEVFFASLARMPAISLTLTQQVLHERERLEAIMKGLQSQIQKGLEKIETLHQTKDEVKKHEADIQRNKDFEIPAKVAESYRVYLKEGEYITNCLRCNYTCHFPCSIPNSDDKASCAAMKNGACFVCKGNCRWKQHVNAEYRIEWRTKTVTRTVKELQAKYYNAKSGKTKYESIVAGLEKELEMKGKEVYQYIMQARVCVQSLEQIALKPNPLSEVEYIELMIDSEKQQKRPGYVARVSTLEKVKKQAKLLTQVTKEDIESLRSIGTVGKNEDSWKIFSM
jgi:predicted GTPase